MSCRISVGTWASRVRGNIDTELKALHEADFLDVKILLCELHFLSQTGLLPGRVFKKRAEKVAQPGNHGHRGIVPFFTHQPGRSR